MLTREVKLKPTKKQEKAINTCLWQLVSVYNTCFVKCEIDLNQGVFPNVFRYIKDFTSHGKKASINQDAIAETIKTVVKSFERSLIKDASNKRSGKPKKKSQRNKINSITYGMASGISAPKERHVRIPSLGKIRCSSNVLPQGKIKGGRLVKRASGFYFQFILDVEHTQEVQDSNSQVGIDTGFKDVLTLSDGTKYENPRELRKGANRLAQAQRGNNKKLSAKLQEKQKNRRKNRNHNISHELVKNHKELYVTEDNLRGQAKKFGKSISEAAIGQLLQFISYKAQSCGRKYVEVSSVNTTKTCGECWNLTGPTGLQGLAVRIWECSACGAVHDRDVNSACVILKSGLGYSLRRESKPV